MPTYGYECRVCGKRFDLFLKMSQSDDPQKCPDCNEEASRVIEGRPAIYFHGRGWSCVDKNYRDGS